MVEPEGSDAKLEITKTNAWNSFKEALSGFIAVHVLDARESMLSVYEKWFLDLMGMKDSQGISEPSHQNIYLQGLLFDKLALPLRFDPYNSSPTRLIGPKNRQDVFNAYYNNAYYPNLIEATKTFLEEEGKKIRNLWKLIFVHALGQREIPTVNVFARKDGTRKIDVPAILELDERSPDERVQIALDVANNEGSEWEFIANRPDPAKFLETIEVLVKP